MSAWRQKILETLDHLPASASAEHRRTFTDTKYVNTPVMAWIELNLVFADAHREENDPFISAVYEYAFWSLCQGELASEAWVGFFEDLPIMWPGVREAMHRFIPPEEFKNIARAFDYHMEPAAKTELMANVLGKYQMMRKSKRESPWWACIQALRPAKA